MKYIVLNYEQYDKYYQKKYEGWHAPLYAYFCEFCNKPMDTLDILWLFNEDKFTPLPKKPYNVYMRLCSETCINLWILS